MANSDIVTGKYDGSQGEIGPRVRYCWKALQILLESHGLLVIGGSPAALLSVTVKMLVWRSALEDGNSAPTQSKAKPLLLSDTVKTFSHVGQKLSMFIAY